MNSRLWYVCGFCVYIHTHTNTHYVLYTFTHTYTHRYIWLELSMGHMYTHIHTHRQTHIWFGAVCGSRQQWEVRQPILYGERDIMFTDVQLSHHDLFVLCKVQRPSWLWVCHLFWVSFETLEGFWFFLNLEKWLLLFCFSSGNLCGWPGWQAQWQLYKRCFLYFMEADPGGTRLPWD